jgi:hypothetical protein
MLWLEKKLACGGGRLQRGGARCEAKGDERRGGFAALSHGIHSTQKRRCGCFPALGRIQVGPAASSTRIWCSTYPDIRTRLRSESLTYPCRIRVRRVTDTRYGTPLTYPRFVDNRYAQRCPNDICCVINSNLLLTKRLVREKNI